MRVIRTRTGSYQRQMQRARLGSAGTARVRRNFQRLVRKTVAKRRQQGWRPPSWYSKSRPVGQSLYSFVRGRRIGIKKNRYYKK